MRCFKNLLSLSLLFLFFCSCLRKTGKHEQLSIETKRILDNADSLLLYGQAKQSILYVDSSFAALKKPTLKDLLQQYQFKCNYYQYHEPDYVKAKSFADSMINMLKGKDKFYQSEYIHALYIKGNVEMIIKNYKQAYRYYYEARELSIKNADKCSYHEYNGNLGVIRYRQKRYAETIVFTKMAFEQSKGCSLNGMLISRQSYLNTIGLSFERINLSDSAFSYYNRALNLIDEEKSAGIYKFDRALAAKGVVYGNIGSTYARIGEYDAAEKYLKLSIAINDKPGFEQIDAQKAKLKLAGLYLKNSRINETKRLILQLVQTLNNKISEKKFGLDNKLKLYELQWKYFEKTNHTYEAYKTLKKYYLLRDSCHDLDRGLRETDFNALFKERAQKDKLAQLEKDAQIKRNYIIVFFVFSLLVVIALVLVWQNRYKLKRLNKEITKQNAVMQTVMTALQNSHDENASMMKIVAHDLRSPIAATISIAEILKTADLSKEDLEMVSILEIVNRQGMDLIANLLNVNTKRDELSIEPVKMHVFLEYCVNLSGIKAEEKKLKLKLTTPEIILPIDEGKIFRVINNIIGNAIKFSPENSIIEITLKETRQTVIISIRDEGIGIPETLKSHIFSIDSISKRKGTNGEDSFGLGLAISKQILDAHNGRIWFESEEGQGTTFFIELMKASWFI